MTACPVCQKPVDPLRARHVGVRDGKIVAFCSAECAALAAADTPVVARPPLAAPEPRPAKAPRTRTPAAGVPVTAPAGGRAPAAGARTPAAGVRIPAAGKDEPAPGPAKDLAAAAAAGAAAGDDSPSASGIRRIRRRKDSLDARAACEWLDDEPAEPTGPDRGDADEPARGRGLLLAALLLAGLGGGGYLAYRYLYLPRAVAPRTDAPLADAAPVSVDAAPAPTPEQQRRAAVERATAALRALSTSGAPHLQRMAAGALSRTGDAASIGLLAAALEKEPSEAARLELAYQLARAGDKRGTDRLVAALALQNRDRRLDAATWLARLGDARAVPVLTAVMAYSQFRLSAAAELAHLANPAAIAVLEQVRADANASPDDKARATIALGRARRADPNELRALLADKRNAEAAPVLAALGDAAAKPVLHEQLGFEHVRVEAARSLRRFGNDGDLRDGLHTLSPALGADSPTAQIRAAEAILLLAGPASWSEKL